MRDGYSYHMIFKRKSFHRFGDVGDEKIRQEELDGIRTAFEESDVLYSDIRIGIRIVPAEKIRPEKDAEYCVLLYSEEKENYLMNAGYVGEQLDLYLVEHGIGSLWYGFGKPDLPEFDGMRFVIMIAIRKVKDPSLFRKDMFKAERKPLSEVFAGDDPGVADVARFAPSACNSQPWFVESRDGTLTVYRYRKPGKSGLIPAAAVAYFNRIDIGIYLCILEICMNHAGIGFDRELFADPGSDAELTKVAEYRIRKSK